MKVKVTGVCQGHARCAAIAPHLFKLDEDGYIRPEDIDVPPGDEALAQRGARACPERALSAVDDGAPAEERRAPRI